MPKVLIVMGSNSDRAVMEEAKRVLQSAGVDCLFTVASAHRTPERVRELAERCEKGEFEVVIAGAGGSAHLAGVLASLTLVPVIGVPIKSSLLGLDSLLSTVQMPGGVPVATVGIDNGRNAGLLALRILALKFPEIKEKLEQERERMRAGVESQARELESEG